MSARAPCQVLADSRLRDTTYPQSRITREEVDQRARSGRISGPSPTIAATDSHRDRPTRRRVSTETMEPASSRKLRPSQPKVRPVSRPDVAKSQTAGTAMKAIAPSGNSSRRSSCSLDVETSVACGRRERMEYPDARQIRSEAASAEINPPKLNSNPRTTALYGSEIPSQPQMDNIATQSGLV